MFDWTTAFTEICSKFFHIHFFPFKIYFSTHIFHIIKNSFCIGIGVNMF